MKKIGFSLIFLTMLVVFSLIFGACPPVGDDSNSGKYIDNPALKAFDGTLNSTHWNYILNEIERDGLFVIVDLSSCTAPTLSISPSATERGGLKIVSSTIIEFDPFSTPSTIGKAKIVSLILPNTATRIVGEFLGFTNLKTISGKSITEIKSEPMLTFKDCSSLVEADLPLLKEIPENTFSNLTNLASVNFPRATTIGKKAFSGTAIKSAHFPVVYEVGDEAFSDCKNLTSIVFSISGVSSSNLQPFKVGNKVFSGCTALESVMIPNSVYLSKFELGDYNFEKTGDKKLTIILGVVPTHATEIHSLGINWFNGVERKDVVIQSVIGGTIGNSDEINMNLWADTWKQALQGKGAEWAGNIQGGSRLLTGTLNQNISVSIVVTGKLPTP